MKINLPNSISSVQDLKSVVTEIRGYAKWFSGEAIKTRVTGVASGQTVNVSETAAMLIKQAAGAAALSQKVLDELITSLDALATTSPRATVTLAGVVSGNLKKTIVDWFRQNVAADILVDFRFNATILGGMVVQYGSHVHDWSFRRSILASRAKFPEVLRRV